MKRATRASWAAVVTFAGRGRDRRRASQTRHDPFDVTLVILLTLLLPATLAVVLSQTLTGEQIIERHHAQGARGAVLPAGRERQLRGTVAFTPRGNPASALAGTFDFTSAAASSRLAVRLGTEQYEGESWSTDGRRVEIAFAHPRTHARSPIGIFLWTNTVVVSEGLLGGVLNARWPLLDIDGRQARVSYDGVKNLGGRELYRLRYRARRDQGALEVLIFLDPATCRHVATIYTRRQPSGLSAANEEWSEQHAAEFRLEEWFSEPVRFGVAALPQTWTLRYVRSGGTPSEWTYEFRIESLNQKAPGAARAKPASASCQRGSGG